MNESHFVHALPPGMAVNLPWTENGPEVNYVEAVLLPGGIGVQLTGHRSEEMIDRVRMAQSCVWSRANELGIPPRLFRRYGIHVHVPHVETDGAAAGLAIAVALASIYTGCAVQPKLAMSGEITLTGVLLPIARSEERIVAARQAGFEKIILPTGNRQEAAALARAEATDSAVVFSDTIQDALHAALPRWMKQIAALKSSL